MNDTLLTGLIGLATTIASWFLARKKNNAEAKKTEVEVKVTELSVVEDAIKIWRETAEALTKKVSDLSVENEKLICEIRRLKDLLNKIQLLLSQIRPDNINEIMQKIKETMGHE